MQAVMVAQPLGGAVLATTMRIRGRRKAEVPRIYRDFQLA
jgi:hypothetical protein